MLQDISETLKKALLGINIKPDERLTSAFTIYLKELLRWNKTYNLTAITEPKEIVYKHFIDSLLYDIFIDQKDAVLCDIGSGAGFPGIPLKIFRKDLKVTLIEPSRKKTAFLTDIRTRLGLSDIEIIQDRAENIRDRTFDIVVSRALFKIPDLIKSSEKILRHDGYIIVSKGTKGEDELRLINDTYLYETKSLEIEGIKRLLIRIRSKG
ncbi:MAG: 16S rRNA (guanine(527)-N(7))-methyltransferase RsmG [Thermodesulfovibrionales bacterium]